MPLCLTFIDLKKAFDTVETEAVIEAMANQSVPTQYIRMLRELHGQAFTILQGGHCQREERCPARRYYFAQTFQCRPREYHASFGMGRLGSEGRRPLPTSPPLCRRHHVYNTEHAERMLAEFDSACGNIGLRLNRTKTMFMKNGLVPEVNMMNDLAAELCRRNRAA
ncbi:hypothetical protein V3C99_018698, partial [Haemonchus contortus]